MKVFSSMFSAIPKELTGSLVSHYSPRFSDWWKARKSEEAERSRGESFFRRSENGVGNKERGREKKNDDRFGWAMQTWRKMYYGSIVTQTVLQRIAVTVVLLLYCICFSGSKINFLGISDQLSWRGLHPAADSGRLSLGRRRALTTGAWRRIVATKLRWKKTKCVFFWTIDSSRAIDSTSLTSTKIKDHLSLSMVPEQVSEDLVVYEGDE